MRAPGSVTVERQVRENRPGSLFEFPNPVNEIAARVVAGGVVLMAAAALGFGEPWLFVPLVYGFGARVLTGPKLSPLGQFATRVVAPWIGSIVLSGGASQAVRSGDGAWVLAVGARVVVRLLGARGSLGPHGDAPGSGVARGVLRSLRRVPRFALLARAGIIPEEVCAACADLQPAPPIAAGPGRSAW